MELGPWSEKPVPEISSSSVKPHTAPREQDSRRGKQKEAKMKKESGPAAGPVPQPFPSTSAGVFQLGDLVKIDKKELEMQEWANHSKARASRVSELQLILQLCPEDAEAKEKLLSILRSEPKAPPVLDSAQDAASSANVTTPNPPATPASRAS